MTIMDESRELIEAANAIADVADTDEIGDVLARLAEIRKIKAVADDLVMKLAEQESRIRDDVMNAMYNGHSKTVEAHGVVAVIQRRRTIDADPDMLRDELEKAGLLAEHMRLDLTKAKNTGVKCKFASVTVTTRDVLYVSDSKEVEPV